jgi:HK97 family phage major capsid protein
MAEEKTMEQLIVELQTGVNDYSTKMEKQLADSQKLINDRLDKIETKQNTPPGGAAAVTDKKDIEGEWSTELVKYMWTKSGFDQLKYIHEYVDTHTKSEVPDYLKTIAANDLTTGGYWLTPTVSNRILETILLIDPMRSVCSVETLRNGDELTMLGEVGTFPCGWTTEQGARAATANMTLTEKRIPSHPMYAMPLMTQKMARIAAFDVEGWMTRRVARSFANLEGIAFVSGNGVGQPEGILTAARRTGTAITHTATGAAASITDFDVLIDMQESLNEVYQQNAVWLMNRSTKAYLRKFQDGMSNYMLESNVQLNYGVNAVPRSGDMLFGKPIIYVPSMDNVGAAVGGVNRMPIAYGDFAEAYTIVDNPGMYTIRDEITTKGAVSLFTERLGVGGGVVDEAAITFLECSV